MQSGQCQVRRGYVNIGSAEQPRRVHYRSAGQGPPLLMLHASPLCSASLLPMIQVAARFRTVIAPDTPGYGWSDLLPEPGAGLQGYVAALLDFTRRLGLAGFGLYGTATGAQLAIELAKTGEAEVDYVILDNVAHFTAAERKRVLAGYFPDLTPDALGSHLTKAWSLARELGLFFPWHEPTPDHRLPAGGVNTDLTHRIAMNYLQAGKDYDLAYRAAFINEKIEQLRPLSMPVTVLRWEGSIIKPYSDRLDRVRWPDNFNMLHCGPSQTQRLEAVASLFTRHAAAANDPDFQLPAPDAERAAAIGFVHDDSGQWHYRRTANPQLPPLLALHDLNSSGRALQGMMEAWRDRYHIFAPDLPGHGLSWQPQSGGSDLAATVATLDALTRAQYRDEPLTILTMRDSAALGIELAARLGQQIKALILLNPIDYPALADEWDGASLRPEFEPDAAGAHLLQTWHFMRDRQLFWPWYARDARHALAGQAELDAPTLTAHCIEFWQAQPYSHALWEELLAYPLGARLAALECNTQVGLRVQDPRTEIGRRSLGAQTCELWQNSYTP